MSTFLRPFARVSQPIVCERERLADRFAENGAGRNNLNHAPNVEFAGASKLRRDRIADTSQVDPSISFRQRFRVVREDIDQRGTYPRAPAQPEDDGTPSELGSASARVRAPAKKRLP